MRRRLIYLLAAVAATAAGAGHAGQEGKKRWQASPPPRYKVVNLGAGQGTVSLNNAGEVLISPPVQGEGQPRGRTVLWRDGKKRELPPGFLGWDLNDHGDVVGSMTFGQMRHAALRRHDGGITDLTPRSRGATEAVAVSNSGNVVLRDGTGRAGWLKKAGGGAELTPLDFVPADVNDAAQVIGNAGGGMDAYFWEKGKAREAGHVPGQDGIALNGLNEAGVAVGNSTSGGPGWVRAFTWAKGGFSEREAIPHPRAEDRLFYGAVALHLNRTGDVVGYAAEQGLPAAYHGGEDAFPACAAPSAVAPRDHSGSTRTAALLWKGTGGAYDLNDHVPGMIRGRRGWKMTAACEINDRGQIVGEGDYRGKPHFFLLTPAK